eukprot:m.194664 g.194664  ORF g.194664 m.194664 type:complete len:62 (-) comp19256_c0_seq1:1436-1621(-)
MVLTVIVGLLGLLLLLLQTSQSIGNKFCVAPENIGRRYWLITPVSGHPREWMTGDGTGAQR